MKIRRVRKMVIGSRAWERYANELARSAVRIGACKRCHHPVIVGYVCTFCDDQSAGAYSDEDI